MAADKFPQTSRDDISPSALPDSPSKTGQTSYNEAMNPPNNPKKDSNSSFASDELLNTNVTHSYKPYKG